MASLYNPANFHQTFLSQLSKQNRDNEQDYQKAKKLVKWLGYIPLLRPDTDVDHLAELFVEREYPHDFAVTQCFHPGFNAYLMYCGFLVIGGHSCEDPRRSKHTGREFQLPKQHVNRCLVQVADYHFSKSVIKRANKYKFSLNVDLPAVIQGCILQHGEAWQYPKIRTMYTALHNTNATRTNVKVVSVELWTEITSIDLEHRKITTPKGDGEGGDAILLEDGDHPIKHCLSTKVPGSALVAGELGVLIGSTYVSLTGFRNTYCDGAGTVQLTALAALLKFCNYQLWDMGMSNEYKIDMGGKEVPRKQFLEQFHKLRDETTCQLTLPPIATKLSQDTDSKVPFLLNARDLINLAK